MRCRQKPRGRRGIFLIEVLGYLVIMAAVVMLVSDMIATSFSMLKETRERDTMITRVDSAMDALRRDAWSANSIQANGDQVTMPAPGGTVIWRMEAEGKLTRSITADSSAKTTWIEMPKFSFTASGPALRVDVESGPAANKHEQATLPSQLMLAGGGK
jgi:Tfp pilus assembly protein PilV